MKIFLWHQRSPREQWVLKVIHEGVGNIAIARTWFPEYNRLTVPPPSVTVPAAIACMARAAIEGEKRADAYEHDHRTKLTSHYQVDLRSNE